jgi:iron-sulfur cluster repair protein YtfE (RIC family)
MTYHNDMTMMYATHDALRRDLDDIVRIAARGSQDPKTILRSAVGWELFKSFLHVHHSAEDDLLWPAMRRALAGDSAAQALLDAMEAEHAAIDPVLVAIDESLTDRESGPGASVSSPTHSRPRCAVTSIMRSTSSR